MPILPIDLQTIFAQMPTVGREQAVQRELTPLQQTVQGQNIVQTSYQQDRSVNQTNDTREGENVAMRRDAAEGKGERGGGGGGAKGQGGEETGAKEEVFRDPALGKHIDVTR